MPFDQLCGEAPTSTERGLIDRFLAAARASNAVYDDVPVAVALASVLLSDVVPPGAVLPEDLTEALLRCAAHDLSFALDCAAFVRLCAESSPRDSTDGAADWRDAAQGAAVWLDAFASHPVVLRDVWSVQRGVVLYGLEAFAPTIAAWTTAGADTCLHALLDLMVRERRAQIADRFAISFHVYETAVAGLGASLEGVSPADWSRVLDAATRSLLDVSSLEWSNARRWADTIQGMRWPALTGAKDER